MMEQLPSELIEMIFYYLTSTKDIIRLMQVCRHLRDNAPNEQKRLLNIQKLYNTLGINAAIKNIKHYIIKRTRVTIRISDKIVIYKDLGIGFLSQRFLKTYTILV